LRARKRPAGLVFFLAFAERLKAYPQELNTRESGLLQFLVPIA